MKDDLLLPLGCLFFGISLLLNIRRVSILEKEIEQIKETNIVCEVEKDVK